MVVYLWSIASGTMFSVIFLKGLRRSINRREDKQALSVIRPSGFFESFTYFLSLIHSHW